MSSAVPSRYGRSRTLGSEAGGRTARCGVSGGAGRRPVPEGVRAPGQRADPGPGPLQYPARRGRRPRRAGQCHARLAVRVAAGPEGVDHPGRPQPGDRHHPPGTAPPLVPARAGDDDGTDRHDRGGTGPGRRERQPAGDDVRGLRPRPEPRDARDLDPRWLCGLSPKEIGQAFLVDTQTIDRRLHRGRGRLRQLGRLPDVDDLPDIGARRDSVLRSLYLLFSEGYHGSNPQNPVRPFLCEDALRLTELLLDAKATAHPDVHALAALFCFGAARLPTRLDEHGVFVPLEDQDRSRWDRARIERGLIHLARSATGDHMSRWHLEAGIACEHAIAPSVQKTDWDRIAGFYQVLAQQAWSPVVALNRALAVAERDGIDAGRRELIALAGEPKLSRYPFYWAARADLERRAGCHAAAREYYERAIVLARSPAERVSFERRIQSLEIS